MAESATTCSEEVAALQASGYCGVAVTLDAGSGGNDAGGGACEELDFCCTSLDSDPAEQAACNQVVSAENSTGCLTDLSAYEYAGTCE
jgi:hypothetical protein